MTSHIAYLHNEWLRTAIEALKADGRFRILSRFEPVDIYREDVVDPANIKFGLYVDVEATDRNPDVAEPIEVGALAFSYDAVAGEVLRVGMALEHFQQPSAPISAEVSRVTGITDAMVEGQQIPPGYLQTGWTWDLVVAHNARYDRRILERLEPRFRGVPWACSYRDVPWQDRFGTGCSKLSHVLADACGEFYDAHRAIADCRVGVHVLATARDVDGRSALSYLLESSRRSTARLYAVGSPFSRKELCKARGYKWSAGDDGRPKAWWTEVPLEQESEEETWIRDIAFGRPARRVITALERYSAREETELPAQRDVADTYDSSSGRGL